MVGRHWARSGAATFRKEPLPFTLLLKNQVADRLVFSKVREKMGGKLRFTVSGGAPLAAELCEFFHACGIPILEGYGLTQTTAPVAVNRPDDYSFGTVGRPLAQTEFGLATDPGEIQLRGPALFGGYYKDADSTAAAFTKDGWFCTGDIGTFDDRGFLKITDRKKELIVTSGGKNITPQKLENRIKQIPLISQALVYGDKQKYLVALITLNESDAKKWAKSHEVEFSGFEELVKNPALNHYVEENLKKMNQELASYETIKRFKILPRQLSRGSAGEVTPSLKLKRKVIVEKYKGKMKGCIVRGRAVIAASEIASPPSGVRKDRPGVIAEERLSLRGA